MSDAAKVGDLPLDQPIDDDGPVIGSLFTGYGGLDLALEGIWPGASIAWVSDIKPGAIKVLNHRFPGIPNLGDITTIDWSTVDPVDIITGGSPCQDVSHAGKRAGMREGTRSGLWASMCDAIEHLQPWLVVWENVGGVLSAQADSDVEPCPICVGNDPGPTLRALGRVLGDLADIGYDACWTGLRAADIGACHGRFRVFVLAWPADTVLEPCREWRISTTREASSRRSPADTGGHGQVPADSSNNGPAGLRPPRERGSRLEDDGREPLTLLRTVMADEAGGGPLHPDDARERGQTLRLTGQILALTGDLLPAPRATRGGSSTETAALLPTVTEADADRTSEGALLPTPAVNDMGAGKTPEDWDSWTDEMKERHQNGNGHGRSLSIETLRDTFGQYAPAIARHENSFGWPAPPPVEPTGRDGANRLSPRFAEWMMGLPPGWITDTPGVTRNEALSLCGDGVVPRQAETAIRHLLTILTTEGAA